MGAETRDVGRVMGEYMQECRVCRMQVQWQLINHPFFGFRAGCDRPVPNAATAQNVLGAGDL